MACDISTLNTNACTNDFDAAAQNEVLWRALVLQLLCNLTGGSSGGSFALYSGNYSGGQPTVTPTATTALAFDTSTGTQWNWYSGAWH